MAKGKPDRVPAYVGWTASELDALAPLAALARIAEVGGQLRSSAPAGQYQAQAMGPEWAPKHARYAVVPRAAFDGRIKTGVLLELIRYDALVPLVTSKWPEGYVAFLKLGVLGRVTIAQWARKGLALALAPRDDWTSYDAMRTALAKETQLEVAA